MNIEQSILLFSKGGAMMYPIFLASIITVAIGIDRFVVYRRAGKDIVIFGLQVKEYMTKGEHKQALQLCKTETNIAAPVLHKAVGCVSNNNGSIIREVMEGEAATRISALRLRLSYLSTIITVAPLLGLLGTVLGMIKTFDVLSLSSGQPGVITGGVGEALIATAAGLCVAIVAAMFYSVLNEKLEDIITELEVVINSLLEVTGEWR